MLWFLRGSGGESQSRTSRCNPSPIKSRSVLPVVYADIWDRKEPTFCLVHFYHDFLNSFYSSNQI